MNDLDLDLKDFGIDLNDDIEKTEPDESKKDIEKLDDDKATDSQVKSEPETNDKESESESDVEAKADEAKGEIPEEQNKPEAPVEAPTPFTKEDLRSLLEDIRTEEHASTRQLDAVYQDIEGRYYPNGISKVLVDSETGRPIRTAQDVIELSGNPDLPIEEAEKWRIAEQSKWDAQVRDIESTIQKVAEQTLALTRGTTNVINRYSELFKEYPNLESKVMAKYLKTITVDNKTNTVIAAPIDIEEYFDDVLEPYRLAYEASKGAAAPPVTPAAPEPVKPTKNDRLDEFGDGGLSDDNDDLNDFEAQLAKEFKND